MNEIYLIKDELEIIKLNLEFKKYYYFIRLSIEEFKKLNTKILNYSQIDG
jgi:hypothetical protein